MRRLRCSVLMVSCLFFCWLYIPAVAAGQDVVMAANVQYRITPSPSNVILELRTATNQSVSWILNGLMSGGPVDGTIYNSVRAETAASMGLDWAAWSPAVVDPTYNRYVVTWNGITQETAWPIVRQSPFEMDRLDMAIGGWAWPQTQFSSKFVDIGLGAIDEAIVPEPASILLLLLGVVLHLNTRQLCFS